MEEMEDDLRNQLIGLGFPDYQIYDLVMKLKGTDSSENEFIIFEHPFKSKLDLDEIFQKVTRGNVLQNLSALTPSEYSWCFRPDSTFEDMEEFTGRISRHIFDTHSSTAKKFEFCIETTDEKIQVVHRLTEYQKNTNPFSKDNLGVIGPTGYFNFSPNF
jgi:hypothetical protein